MPTQSEEKIAKKESLINYNDIRAFKEAPSVNRYNSPENPDRDATDLFSAFTADIIKQEVEFTR